MALKIYDKIIPANDTFYIANAEDIEYKGTSILNHLFVALTEEEYYDKLEKGELDENTPYLIISDQTGFRSGGL